MKAFVYDRYGPADVLRLAEVPTPTPTAEQIRVRIHAVSINGSDREGLAGKPLYARVGGPFGPRGRILGSDIAGVVESTGAAHTEFKVGDQVFGEIPNYGGGFAEYFCSRGKTLAHKPDALGFVEAAAIPQGGVIAWNGIRKKGEVKAGQQVLINGAGGSGGSFAIQLARNAGAEVTGVDNAHKQDFMRSLGAEHVIDFAQTDFTRTGRRYDLILDLIAHRSVFRVAKALKPGGKYFFVGGSTGVIFQALIFGGLLRRMRGVHIGLLMVPQNRADLIEITERCLSGEVKIVIDRQFTFDETPAAMRYVSDGFAKGKVVIKIGDPKGLPDL